MNAINVTIRPAERNDCSGILNLILAKSQKLGIDATISLKDLQRDGFDMKPAYYYCLVAEDEKSGNGEILGFAMYYHRYSTWESKGLHLRCLTVSENISYTEEVKEKLLKTLCKFGVEEDFCRLSFRELASNSSEMDLYLKLGALNLTKDKGWLLFCFPNASVQKILKETQESEDKLPNIKVRIAERRDCQDIAKLIKEFADFEKMGDKAKLTGEDLARDCFDDPNKYFRTFVAEDKESNEVIGFAIFCNTYKENFGKSIHLGNLYVTPEFRRTGVGKKLFAAVAKVSNDEHHHGFSLECLDWNTPAIKFYEKNYGNNLTSQWGTSCCRFGRDAMEALKNSCM